MRSRHKYLHRFEMLRDSAIAVRKATALTLTLLLVLGMFSGWALPVTAESSNQEGGEAGTSLTVTITAQGDLTECIKYDWDIKKTVSPTSIEIEKGEAESVTYTLDITKEQTYEKEQAVVEGKICVFNKGDTNTVGLNIEPQVEYKVGSGQFQALAGASQTIIPSEQIPANSSQCYSYKIEFDPVAGATYRVASNVTITNHSGPDDLKGPKTKADFTLPAEPSKEEIVDEEAHVTDALNADDLAKLGNFTLTHGSTYDNDGWHFTNPGSISYTIEIQNDDEACGKNFNLRNTATLTELDSGQKRDDSAAVDISTGECSTTPPSTTPPSTTPPSTTPPSTTPPSTGTPSSPGASVNAIVVTAPTTSTTIVEIETPTTTVEKKTVTTESTPAREELPYTGMNGFGALLAALLLMTSGMFIYRNSKV